jgi:hypothetical protein
VSDDDEIRIVERTLKRRRAMIDNSDGRPVDAERAVRVQKDVDALLVALCNPEGGVGPTECIFERAPDRRVVVGADLYRVAPQRIRRRDFAERVLPPRRWRIELRLPPNGL